MYISEATQDKDFSSLAQGMILSSLSISEQ